MTAPQIGETDRQIKGVTAYLSRDPQVEIASGTSARVGKPDL